MQVLFVHGMGRSQLSGWPMLWRLKAHGLMVGSFGYVAAFEDFSAIRTRLVARISEIAAQGDYVVVGHSLGGILLRAAIAALPAGTRLPLRLFLLGSPVKPARLAQKLRRYRTYRMLTGDCGQLLSSKARMAEIGPTPVPATSIVGISGYRGKYSPFEGETNDGIICISEARAEWIAEEIRLPVLHTFLPWSQRVAKIILAKVALHVD
ncbi:MAG: esterase/lipase family protein [Gammaproteobacteria bacterium]